MTDFKEQKSASDFVSILKIAAETHRMLQEAFRDNVVSKNKTFYGANASRADKRVSTTKSVLDDRRQAQHWKT